MRKNKDDVDLDFLFLVFMTLILGLFIYRDLEAKDVRTLRLNHQTVGRFF